MFFEVFSSVSLLFRTFLCVLRFVGLFWLFFDENRVAEKTLGPNVANGDFDAKMTLSREGKQDLHWWLQNTRDMCAPIYWPYITKTLTTDASAHGWGAVMAGVPTRGA